MNILFFALKNLQRNRGRTILLLAVIAAASITLFSTTLFHRSISSALGIGSSRLGADIYIVPAAAASAARSALATGKPAQFLMDRTILHKVSRIKGIKTVSAQIYLDPAGLECCADMDIFLTAFDPATDFSVMPWLNPEFRRSLAATDVVGGQMIPLAANSVLHIAGMPFKVVKKLDRTGMDFFDKAIFISIEAAYRLADSGGFQSHQISKDRISAVLAQTTPDEMPGRVAVMIERSIPGVKTLVIEDFASTLRKQLSSVSRTIFGISLALWITVLCILAFSFTMIMNERQREIGLLRAMGASQVHIAAVPLIEAGVLTAAGSALGIASGMCLLALSRDILHTVSDIPFTFPPTGSLASLAFTGMLFSVCTGLVSALLPAIRAARWDPYESIRNEE